MANLKMTSIRLSEPLRARARLHAARRGQTLSRFIRCALDAEIERQDGAQKIEKAVAKLVDELAMDLGATRAEIAQLISEAVDAHLASGTTAEAETEAARRRSRGR